MTGRGRNDMSERCHALNNLFTTILWTTELALEQAPQRGLKAALEAIATLALSGGDLVEDLRSGAGGDGMSWSG